MSFKISVLLCETKINDVDLVDMLTSTNNKVGRFDITMDEMVRVNILDTSDLCNPRNKIRQ